MVSTFLANDGLSESLSVLGEDGGAARGSVQSFRTPERAVAALAHAARYGRWLDRPVGSIPVLDVCGKILVGFDARAVDRALGTPM